MNIIENLKWRYATKKFDPSRKVEDEKIELLKEAIQLSASSIGLQPYVVLEVKNPEIRKQLQAATWGQPQVVDASHLFVFCNMTSLSPEYVEACAELHRSERNADEASKVQFKAIADKILTEKTSEQQKAWSEAEAFIAVGTALAACAEMQIDSCPMGGFSAADYNRILGLNEKGLNAALVLPVGYRSADDALQFAKKVRKPASMLFEEIK